MSSPDMTPGESYYVAPEEPWKGHRACLECRRKKTRCDMNKPNCGLCSRTGVSCTFPTKRKKPQRRRPESQTDSQKLERLVTMLESRLGEGQDIEMLLSQAEQLPRICLHKPYSLGRARDDSTDESPSEIIVVDTSHMRDISTSPASTLRSADAGTNWLSVPGEVLTDLVDIFFSKIQGWLPLLHRPRFFNRFMKNGAFIKRNYSNSESLLLCGMFALAARYSNHAQFRDIPAPDRGQLFEKQANTYYEKYQSHQPSLETLQGCILLATCVYASRPSHRAWILAGVCVRLAYDLNLCNMDEHDESMDWTILEEQRRAFWLTWELDVFGSSITRRPSFINRSTTAVRLPVTDEAWFADQPVASPIIDPRPSECWKILLDSPNKDPRAWFLVASALLSIASEFAAGRFTCQRDKEELIDAIICFSLAISQRFGLQTLEQPVLTNDAARHNWIIGIHLILTCARTTIQASFKAHCPDMFNSPQHLSRIFHHWYPDYIPLSQPFLACCLLTDRAFPSTRVVDPPYTAYHNNDLVNLVLSHLASVWNLASVLKDLRASLARNDNDASFEKRFALFYPPRVANTNSDSRSDVHSDSLGALIKESRGSNQPPEENGSSSSQLLQPSNLGDAEILMAELANLSSRGFPRYMQGGQQVWTDELSSDYLEDDHQHLNYLQL